MFRSIAILIVSAVMCSWASAENPQVTIAAYNDVAVPDLVLQKAEEVAGRIYKSAGIALHWKDCTTSPGQQPCSRTERESTFSIRIVARSLNLSGEAFGIAFVGDDGLGQQADVFYSGIEMLQSESTVAPAEILGHVMAHELGHLLLGLRSHSSDGIMQAHWTDSQLQRISMGRMTFDSRQAGIMRGRLLGPYASLRSGDPAATITDVTKVSWPPM